METKLSLKHLKPATQKWVAEIMSNYELESQHIRLLILAGESWDRAMQARKAIEVSGMIYLDKAGQPKPRPETIIERDQKILFARLMRELSLDNETLPDSRLPHLKY